MLSGYEPQTQKAPALCSGLGDLRSCFGIWLRGQDLNLRPSGYEPDELPGCSTPRQKRLTLLTQHWQAIAEQMPGSAAPDCASALPCKDGVAGLVLRRLFVVFCRPGSDLLSRVLRQSTIGAGAFHGRVRNGTGCSHPAITTRSAKNNECEKLVFFVGLFHPVWMNISPLIRGG